MKAFSTLLFDLDGTLIDSAPDVCASVNRVLETMGRPNITVSNTKKLVGFGAATLVKKALEMTGLPGSEKEIDYLLNGFLNTYRQNPSVHTVIFPGVLEALERFAKNGIKMGICTNKPEATCYPVLEALNLRHYFKTVVCGDAVAYRKPDPRHIYDTLNAMGVKREGAAFIGDSEADIKAANSAGLPSVCVTFGYCHEPFENLGASALIEHFDELDGALNLIAGKTPSQL